MRLQYLGVGLILVGGAAVVFPSKKQVLHTNGLFWLPWGVAGAFCFLMAFDCGPVSLISPASSVYPSLLALLAFRFLKDKVKLIQGIGIGIITGGLVTVGFSGF